VIQRWGYLVPTLISLLAAAVPLGSGAATGDYELIVEGDLVSLEATQAPLAQVLGDLGKKAGFEVDAETSEDVTVTLDFKKHSVDDAITALCKPVGYLLVRDPANNRIRKVVLTPNNVQANRTAERQAEPPGWSPKEPLPPDTPEVPLTNATDGAVDPG